MYDSQIIRYRLIAGVILTLVTILVSPPVSGHHETSPRGEQAPESVRIGVLAKRGTERCLEKWGPTADYLTTEIPGHSFTILPLDYDEIYAVTERKQVNFVLANSSFYVGLEQFYGASRILTLKNLHSDSVYTIYGGVIFRRADRNDIGCLNDLKGKTFMAVEERSFGGWLTAWRELKEHGIDPYRDFADLRFGGTHDAVVYAVRDGKVDAGSVRTDVLDRMAMEGKINVDDFCVFHDHGSNEYFRDAAGAPFPHSTRFYPKWPMAKTSHTSDELAEKVAAALLKMSPDSPAAKAARCAGWTIPLNYQSVHECLKYLRVGPYEDYGKVTLRDVVQQYLPWILGAVALMIIVALFVLRVTGLNRRLRESEERLRTILDSLHMGIVIVDADTHAIVDVNPTAATMIGAPKEQIVGHECHRFICPAEKGKCPITDLGQIVDNSESVLIRADGTSIPILKTVTSVTLNGRRHLVDSFVDLSERVRCEKELKQLFSAVNQAANMTCITDPEGIIEYVNPAFCEVTGYTVEEAVGSPASFLKSGKQDSKFYGDLWNTIKDGIIWKGNIQNRRKNGEIYWERKTISPILSKDGRITNFLSIGSDITSEIIAQQRVAEADKMSAVGMLAAGVAHEFKNYLGGIIGNASFAAEQLDDDGGLELARDSFQQVIELGDKANDIAMSLLTYSKARPDDYSRENLAKIIQKTINLVEKEMHNLSIEIATYFEEAPKIEVSTSKIQQLLLNLLINAQHAIRSSGVVTIALINAGNYLRIKVADTGVGIPPENLGRIFDPFFSTKGVWGEDETVGTGMGLSICRNIARDHGGDLTVESIVGMGTTFTLSLPINRHEVPDFEELNGKDDSEQTILVFTLDKSIISHYHRRSCELKTKILAIDSVANIQKDIDQIASLVICDAGFAGKMELLKMTEMCQQAGVPYVMVKCGAGDYQLADLFEASAGSFKELPDLSHIIDCARSADQHKCHT